MAVRAEFHIERALRTVKHRIPLNLGQIFHRFPAVGAGRIFRVLYPVGKATHRVHILAGRTVKQGHRRFAQHKGIFREGLVVLGTDIAIRLLRSVKEFGGEHLHAAIQGKPVEGGAFQKSHTAGATGGSQDAVQPQKFQTLIPAIQHQHIHHTPAAVRAGVLPCPANADGRFLASGSLDQGKAGVEVELDFLALLVEGPAADLRIAGWVYIEALAPGPGISLQLQQSLHCLVISLHRKATHQVGGRTGILCGEQLLDQTISHIGGSVIIDLTGPEHLCGQCRPLDLRGDGIMVAKQLPEVGELRVLHIRQPLDVLYQVSLFFDNLFRHPGQSSLPFLLALTFPTQSLITQWGSTAGAGIFQTHVLILLSGNKKAPRRTVIKTG